MFSSVSAASSLYAAPISYLNATCFVQNLALTQENVPRLDVSLLDPDDAFVIDLFKTICVWIGDGATEQEREGAIVFAEG